MKFNSGAHFFGFQSEMPFLGKFGSKSQNYLFELKSGTYTNSNMQISMEMFTFFLSDQKCPFLEKFGPKYQNCQFKAKLAN